jgi:hypothetical protein
MCCFEKIVGKGTGKVEVVPVYTMKAYGESRSLAPLFRNPGSRWK